jgi:hypothetical protein
MIVMAEIEERKESTMWKNYRKKVIQPMRPYVPGEDLTGVSVNPKETPVEGGMIAKDDEGAQWYVTPEFFQKSYEEVPEFNSCEHGVQGGKQGGCENCD